MVSHREIPSRQGGTREDQERDDGAEKGEHRERDQRIPRSLVVERRPLYNRKYGVFGTDRNERADMGSGCLARGHASLNSTGKGAPVDGKDHNRTRPRADRSWHW